MTLVKEQTMRDDIKTEATELQRLATLIENFRKIYDPEIELDIYSLGLVYGEIDLDEEKAASWLCRLLKSIAVVLILCLREIIDSHIRDRKGSIRLVLRLFGHQLGR